MNRVFWIVFLLNSHLFAQNSPSHISLKLQSRILGHFQLYNEMELQGLIPAILFEDAKLHLHQIEIFRFRADGVSGKQNELEANFRNLHLGIGYEYLIPLNFGRKTEDWQFYLGIGSGLSIYSFRFNPNTSNDFHRFGTDFSWDIYGSPFVRRYLSPKFFLEVSSQLYIWELGFNQTEIQNPSLPINTQITKEFRNNPYRFRKIALRFGLGMKL